MNLAVGKFPAVQRTVSDKLPSFSAMSKFWLGDEGFFDSLVNWDTNTSYPRFNIVKMKDQGYRIEIAVPGLNRDELHVTLEDGWLRIRGNHVELIDKEFESYEHQGLSTKAFERSFKISDTLKLERAYLDNGLLCLELFFINKGEQKVQEIPIL